MAKFVSSKNRSISRSISSCSSSILLAANYKRVMGSAAVVAVLFGHIEYTHNYQHLHLQEHLLQRKVTTLSLAILLFLFK